MAEEEEIFFAKFVVSVVLWRSVAAYSALCLDRDASMSAKQKVLCTSCEEPITSKVLLQHCIDI